MEQHDETNTQKAESSHRQKLIDYAIVFGSDRGQRVLEDLRERCGMDYQCHDPLNAHNTSFNDGRRCVYLYIDRQMKMAQVMDNPLQTHVEE